MAYSSIEHMGVVALGFGFGGPLGVAGALLPHAQSLAEQVADVLRRRQHDARLRHKAHRADPRGRPNLSRSTGALWLAGAVAITGAPPFGLFLSEFTIMRAGLQPAFSWAVYFMAVLLIVIFIGFMNHFRVMYYGAPASSPTGRRAERLVRRADVAGADRRFSSSVCGGRRASGTI